ncbi:hypothetical protein HYDPIDRAFT_176765 [Hydnomerulius pinastri MD-312]|uniref:Uncharacterized protein n=1 Tax=Hydnomerulius pinastri MD-312 TaxID=994086 RepID=A0A0C9WCY1_9AGAM|nr:hypothetical protein HYDPIDRAFT_176765 [Hydnomerulius pinastri MD-312]
MDNPWAGTWEPPEQQSGKQVPSSAWKSDAQPRAHDQEADIGLPSWSSDNPAQWTAPTHSDDAVWGTSVDDARAWTPSTYEQIDLSAPDHEEAPSTPPHRDAFDAVPETTDEPHGGFVSRSDTRSPGPEDDEPDAWADSTMHAAPDDEWGSAWATVPPSESTQEEVHHPDEWETARQEKEKLNRAVPPELLASMLRHCQQISNEIWPEPESPKASSDEDWRTGLDGLQNIAKLLAELIPEDVTLPPPVQLSATATGRAMNEALKLTRHMPLAGNSPLARLLASKGSLDWEKSIKFKQEVISDAAPVGWRILEKEDRLNTTEDSKSKKAASGLLSFWNRRTSTIPAAATEVANDRSRSPARSSLDSVKSTIQPQPSRDASPSKPPSISAAMPPFSNPSPAPEITVAAPSPAPSAVSRFLNRFSRAKSSNSQHSSLALSSDDLEFLSDIVPSANDPEDDEHDLTALSSVVKSSPLPPKLPPPLAPPPKPPSSASSRLSMIGPGESSGASLGGALTPSRASPAPRAPVLPSPLSPISVTSLSRPQSPAVPPKSVTPALNMSILMSPAVTGSSTSSTIPRLSSPPQPSSRSHSPFTLPPPPKVPASLSIPPLLPPPPLSPPQTPRPSAFPSTATITPSSASTMWPSASPIDDLNDSDDEFSAFSSFPPPTPNPPQRSPSPPSPPPQRNYQHTHFPSSSAASVSSIMSPASQNSGDQLRSARSSISASFDDFDDFVSSPMGARGRDGRRGESGIRTPSPPPLPAKQPYQFHSQSHPQPHPINTHSSPFPHARGHAHTPSYASPTVHTGLMSASSSSSSVWFSDHQRTQSLVDQAAALGGHVWPNSPEEPKVRAIPPPSLTSPIAEEGELSLLGDGFGFGFGAGADGMKTPPPRQQSQSLAGLGIGMGVSGGISSSVSSPVMSPTRAPPGSSLGAGLGMGVGAGRISPSPPPLPSTSTPLLSFSSLGSAKPTLIQPSQPPVKATQTGGLSAQDLSFFEGL